MRLLKSGKFSAMIAPKKVGLYLAKKLYVEVKIIAEVEPGTPVAIAVKKGNLQLLNMLESKLQTLINEGEIHKLKQVMEENVHMGMQTFDNALANMCKRGLISREEATAGADDPSFVQLKMGLGGISISPEPEETIY